MPPEVANEVSHYLTWTEYGNVRLSSPTVAEKLDVVRLYTRFCLFFPTYLQYGTDFAIDLVRARNDESSWTWQLNPQQDTPPTYHKSNKSLQYWVDHAIAERNLGMLTCCLDTLSRYRQFPVFQNDSQLVSRLTKLAKRIVIAAGKRGWSMGVHLASELVMDQWRKLDDSVDKFKPDAFRICWIITAIVEASSPVLSDAVVHIMDTFLRNMADDPWDRNTSVAAFYDISKSPRRILPLLLLRSLARAGLVDAAWQSSHYTLLRHGLWKDDTTVADEIISLIPAPLKTSLASIAGLAAEKSFERVAYHVVEKMTSLGTPVQLNLHSAVSAITYASNDDDRAIAKVWDKIRYLTSPKTHKSLPQRILIHYAQQTCIVEDDKLALEGALDSCLYGHPLALQTLISAFPSKATAYIQQLTENDILRSLQFDFDLVANILLQTGWRPKSAPRWVRRCVTEILNNEELENPWADSVGTVKAVHAHGLVIENSDVPLIRFVIRQLAGKAPADSDLKEGEVIRRLLDLGVSVDKGAVVAATEANLWGCVGVLAEKLRAVVSS